MDFLEHINKLIMEYPFWKELPNLGTPFEMSFLEEIYYYVLEGVPRYGFFGMNMSKSVY